jgi:hypothetical protein
MQFSNSTLTEVKLRNMRRLKEKSKLMTNEIEFMMDGWRICGVQS